VSGQPADTSAQAEAADSAAALDLLLAAAALGPLRRFLPGRAGVRLAAGLARLPHRLARQAAWLAGELARVGLGSSTLAPPARDRRFADPAWTSNPLLRRLVQAYLATGQSAERLLADADLQWRDAERMRFVVDNLVQVLAPSNNPATSPVFWKAVVDSGGGNILRGARHLAADLATPPRIPSMVEPDAFEVGADLAVTPGAVVLRTPVFELLQYQPQTPKVHRVPLLIVPPTINKHYILDLAPGRSLVEYLIGSGQQVFVISWRNPDARHRHWDADTYGQAILQAQAATQRICRADRSLLLGLCSGGILAAMALAHLAATGRQHRVAGFSLAVSVLDQARAGMASAALDEGTAQAAIAASAARGFLDGRALAEVFAWLRPGDLIWSYWVNNYLQGRTPPAFDILFWNADTTKMPAGLHRDFVRLAIDNALTHPGTASMLGSPVDLAKVDIDAYVVAGIADHLCPGSPAIGAPSCSAAARGSCCPAAATSPPWSTRRATSGPASRWRRTPRRTRPTGWLGRPPNPAPGGPTTPVGWRSAAARSGPGRGGWAPRASPRPTPPRAPTSWTAEARGGAVGTRRHGRGPAAACGGPSR
jgi:polyhydroxyalkanoate synthase